MDIYIPIENPELVMKIHEYYFFIRLKHSPVRYA